MIRSVMPEISWTSPVHETIAMGSSGDLNVVLLILDSFRNVEVRMIEWAQPLSWRALTGTLRDFGALNDVLMSILTCTNFGWLDKIVGKISLTFLLFPDKA